MKFNEAKKLISSWDKSSFGSLADSTRYHARTHGYPNDVAKYLRKAANFNKSGAKKITRPDGTVRWVRSNGEYLIERNGKIVSYGTNKV